MLAKADGDKFALFAESISKDDDDEKEENMAADPKLVRFTVTPIIPPISHFYQLLQPLIQQLNTFNFDPEILSGNVALTPLAPEYRAVPCKPLFFDLALNHIRFPNLDEEINANAPKAGLTGMVKGWLGGWGAKK